MSAYTSCSDNRHLMSIPNLMVPDIAPSATPKYHHQPLSPSTFVASGSSIQIPRIVVHDDQLYNPGNDRLSDGDGLVPCYPAIGSTFGGSKYYEREHGHHQQQASGDSTEERRRRNKVASAKYRAKRNQENERLRRWIDDLRRQNAVLIKALNDVHCQGNSSGVGGNKHPPSHGSATTNGYTPHGWTTFSWGNSTISHL